MATLSQASAAALTRRQPGRQRTSHDVLGLYDRQCAAKPQRSVMDTLKGLGYSLERLESGHWVVQRRRGIEQIHLYSRQEIASFICQQFEKRG